MWCNIQSVEKYFFVMKLWACFSFVFKQQCLNKIEMLNAVFWDLFLVYGLKHTISNWNQGRYKNIVTVYAIWIQRL